MLSHREVSFRLADQRWHLRELLMMRLPPITQQVEEGTLLLADVTTMLCKGSQRLDHVREPRSWLPK